MPVIRTPRGFSLIELLVTVSIVAILLAVAVPSFTEFMEKARLRGAADDIVSMIANARGQAVKSGRDVTVAMGGTTTAWCIGANAAATPAVAAAFATSAACNCANAGECIVDGGRQVVSSGAFGGVTASAVTANWTFDGKLGSVIGLGTSSFNLTSANARYQVQLAVSPLGQTRVCVPSGQRAISGYPSC